MIGLTIVAVGTSLPELATASSPRCRKHTEIAVGNVVGSNVFNILGILGITALVAPIPVDPRFAGIDMLALALPPSAWRSWPSPERPAAQVAGIALLAAMLAYRPDDRLSGRGSASAAPGRFRVSLRHEAAPAARKVQNPSSCDTLFPILRLTPPHTPA